MTDLEKLADLLDRAHHNASCVAAHHESEGEALEEEARYLLANGVTIQRMTPITEEVPSGECLAVNDCGVYMVGEIVKDPYSTVTGYSCINNEGIEVGIEDVTHWQRLPELPKGVNHV